MSSTNKVLTTWNTVKSESRRTCANEGITKMSINGRIVDNPQIISDSLNNYFLHIATKIINTQLNSFNSGTCNSLI